MTSSVTTSTPAQLGNYPPAIAAALIATQTAAAADISALQAGGVAGSTPVHVVDLIATAALPTYVYNATAKTITVTATGTLTVDGQVTALNQRILLPTGAAGSDNGIYFVSTAGASMVQAVLTRAPDANTSADFQAGMLVTSGPLGSGNDNAIYQLQTANPITLDTTSLTFAKVANSPASAGTALTAGPTQTALKSAGLWRTLPAATLTAAATLTLSPTGAVAGDVFDITRLDVTGWSYTVVDGGSGTPTLCVLSGGEPSSLKAQFNGTNWLLKSLGQLVDDITVGTALTDAGSTAIVRAGRRTWVTLPALPLTASRSYALPTLASSTPGDLVFVTRLDAAAYTATFTDSGSGTPTLLVMPASKVNSATFVLNAAGTHWLLLNCGVQ